MGRLRPKEAGFLAGLALIVLAFLAIVAYGTLLISGRTALAPVLEKRAQDRSILAEAGLKRAMVGLLDETVPPVEGTSGAFTPGLDVAIASGDPTKLLGVDPGVTNKVRASFEDQSWIETNAPYIQRLNQLKSLYKSLTEDNQDKFMLTTLFLDQTKDPNDPTKEVSTKRRLELSSLEEGTIKAFLMAIEQNSTVREVVGYERLMRRWQFIRLPGMDDAGGYDFTQQLSIHEPAMARVYIARGVLVQPSTYTQESVNHPRLMAVSFQSFSGRIGMKALSVELMGYHKNVLGEIERVPLQSSDLQNGVCWYGNFREETFGLE
jgi:hypothetical protein